MAAKTSSRSLGKSFAQLGAARTDIFEKFFIFDDIQELEGHGARQRATAKSGAMHSGRDAGGNLLRGENGAKRKSGGERLGDQNNVRLGGKYLIAEEAAGAAEAGLNFIGDHPSARLGGERASAVPEFFA